MGSPSKKIRVDHALTQQGLADSRAKAQALLMAGLVLINDQPVTKPGAMVAADATIRLRAEHKQWVARSAEKLLEALTRFQVDVRGAVALDVGASTGGFTEVLLKHGAEKVHAIDVGHNQLAWALRQDPRVVVKEKCNARYMTTADLEGDFPSVMVCDVSFIGLALILPTVLPLLATEAVALVLVKPQFELGKEFVDATGIVRDPLLHQQAVDSVANCFHGLGWQVHDYCAVQTRGRKGNQEFVMYASTP
ncbi:MAG: TlyA family RNA methyltransferase [Alphaproteobacteria bacterium]|nr:TlyA family RNA methyltransferase [Alphaproteobacteria bacterium]